MARATATTQASDRPPGKSGLRDRRHRTRRQRSIAAFGLPKWPRQKTHLHRSFNPLASGPSASGNILLSFFQKLMFSHAIPPHRRGVRVVTNVEAGCDGRVGLQRASRADEQHDAHGEVVWS